MIIQNKNKGLQMLKNVKGMFSNKGEKGASAVEYALIAGLIAVVIIGAVTLLGGNINTTFTSIANALGVK